MSIKFSIITPSFNSGDTLERAIQSVISQDYEDFEHIIVDGGSSDRTGEILEKYPHLKWISEADDGQVDAMKKGFSMAEGDLIGYLNADDYYLEGTFLNVAEAFKDHEIKMVVGKVRVYSEENDSWWVNDPAVDIDSMLRHWEKDAFCVNPVGYFYRKEVQDQVPLNRENDDKQDLEFLIGVADRFPGGIRKENRIFGEFINSFDTKTSNQQQRLDYWTPENFAFLDRFIEKRSPEYQEEFRARQSCGYQVRTRWTIKKAIKNGRADQYFEDGELLMLPADEFSIRPHQVFAGNEYVMAEGGTIVVVLSAGKNASQAFVRSLNELPAGISQYPAYHLHLFGDVEAGIRTKLASGQRAGINHLVSGQSLRNVWEKRRNSFKWKFISGVRDPVSQILSLQFMNHPGDFIYSKDDFLREGPKRWPWISEYFDRIYKKIIGIDVFEHQFDHDKGYSIIRQDNVELLLYTFEQMKDSIEEAMLLFLGIPDFELLRSNESKDKEYRKEYVNAIKMLEGSFTREDLTQFYSHKVVSHFYSQAKINQLLSRWVGQGLKNSGGH